MQFSFSGGFLGISDKQHHHDHDCSKHKHVYLFSAEHGTAWYDGASHKFTKEFAGMVGLLLDKQTFSLKLFKGATDYGYVVKNSESMRHCKELFVTFEGIATGDKVSFVHHE